MEECSYKNHNLYGEHDRPASVLVRITCRCGYFRIRSWCDECYDRVTTSGKTWQCKECLAIVSNEEKLRNVVRIGDA